MHERSLVIQCSASSAQISFFVSDGDLSPVIFPKLGRVHDPGLGMSGFIFFFQYAESIRTRAITYREFALLRFSRLYPLHAITLVTVAVGQWLYQRWEGHLFVYGCNDWKRFIQRYFHK